LASPEADLLKVKADAGLEEIKKAYRKAALAHHPDQNPHPEAARHFRRLTEAYRILADQAQRKEPTRPPHSPTLSSRMEFLLLDIRALLKRWPEPRWGQRVDGLPAVVWVAGALEVLGRTWPGESAQANVPATRDGIANAVEAWQVRLSTGPLPHPLPRALSQPLMAALTAAETRVRALDRPARRPSK